MKIWKQKDIILPSEFICLRCTACLYIEELFAVRVVLCSGNQQLVDSSF